ncbi:MAG: baseplate J/gp47 family protein [Bacilli bacterium]
MRKDREEILEDIMQRMRAEGPVTATKPGAIARLFAECLAYEIGDVYTFIEEVKEMAYLSSSRMEYLDLIAELLNQERQEDESDDEFRARIASSTASLATANREAIRVAALLVNGVADVRLEKFTKGVGSFTVYIVPESFPVDPIVVSNAQRKVLDVCAYGMDAQVKLIDRTPIDVAVEIIIDQTIDALEKQYIYNNARNAIRTYIDEVSNGGNLIIAELQKRIMNSNKKIYDVEISEIRVNDKQVDIKNIYQENTNVFYVREIAVN